MLYPVQTQSRGLMDLSGIWDFKLDDGNGFEEKWYESPLKEPMTMAVPSSYNDLKDGVDFRDHYGWVFYQRKVTVPSYMRSQRLVLRMAAVTHIGKVYLNGKLVCEHKGGFLPFEAEINDFLIDGENLLTIAVDNRIDHSTLPVGSESGGGVLSGGGLFAWKSKKPKNNPNFDFFNYCGITRPVKLYTTPKDYIADVSLDAQLDGNRALVSYQVETVGTGNVHIEIWSREGEKVAEAEGKEGKLIIEHVHLWQPLHAYLYEVKVTFGEDSYNLPYGIRTVKVEGGKFLIN